MAVKLSLSGVSYLVNEFKSKILNNFITQVTVINNSDIYFSFFSIGRYFIPFKIGREAERST